MAESNQPDIVIRKVKKGGHGGHHGGSWKVAYADFVTAMMAFFLLLWLLNATTQEQRTGISNYFAPGSVSKETSGTGGILGGMSPNPNGAMNSTSPVHVTIALPPVPGQTNPTESNPDSDDTDGGRDKVDQDKDHSGGQPTAHTEAAGETAPKTASLTEAQKKAIAAEEQEKAFKKAEQELRQAIQAVPELRALKDSLIIDRTPDGMRIQIVDQDKLSMFPLGSAQMYDYTRELLAQVAKAVELTKNKIAIEGHTDAHPYTTGANYGNWELSSDRANASRRALLDAGLPADRIARVVGKADTDPLFPKNPLDPRNRRISITLLQNTQG
ncbi:MAG TPA: flagellar motor protein MotB [Alphaproteobacteria bacterium]|nr:flagellar motor protein MotB [Alphaproteobacteria bacterium]